MPSERWAFSVLDSALGDIAGGIENFRTSLQQVALEEEEGLPRSPHPRFVGDAAIAGCAAGFACGTLITGSPKLMAISCAAGFSYAAKCPDRVPRWLDRLSHRSAVAMRNARKDLHERLE
jgi:hypothetical protein